MKRVQKDVSERGTTHPSASVNGPTVHLLQIVVAHAGCLECTYIDKDFYPLIGCQRFALPALGKNNKRPKRTDTSVGNGIEIDVKTQLNSTKSGSPMSHACVYAMAVAAPTLLTCPRRYGCCVAASSPFGLQLAPTEQLDNAAHSQHQSTNSARYTCTALTIHVSLFFNHRAYLGRDESFAALPP
ncbi:hypothetical protein TNCV_1990321 [Trichonephila clavipes]|nr:hypothetical protein TNCV_1990321 [Trichonephila clavipes]